MVDGLIQPDRVHRSIYTDAGLYALERERLFKRSWLYLGHDSQVPKPGDVYAATLADQSVLLIRQPDGIIRAFLNRCMHKGMQLLPDRASTTVKALRCGYHGWIYGLDGALKSVPAPNGYACPAREMGLGLAPVPGFESYRGFLFGRLSSDGPDLKTWLGPLRASLDNMIDRAPAGRLEVAGGVLRYEHQCNWKFFFENTLDALHPMVVHHSAAHPAKRAIKTQSSADPDEARALSMLAPFVSSYSFFDDMGQRGGAYGHGELGGRASIHSDYQVDDAYWQALVDAHGADKTKDVLSFSANNSVLYPTVMFKAPLGQIRVIRPLGVDRTVIETWHFKLVGAPNSLLEQSLQYSTIVNASAGIVGPDDHEAYRRLQAGLQDGPEWVLMNRHLGAEEEEADGSLGAVGTSDHVFRNQYAAWHSYMSAP